MSAPGWKGEATECCIWGCGRLAEFDRLTDMGPRPVIWLYYCAIHAPEDAMRYRTLAEESA